MRPIPVKMRAELQGLERMKRCELEGMDIVFGFCHGRRSNPEWHHVWEYAGRQVNEVWAIVAGCTRHHGMVKSDPSVQHAFEAASLLYASEEDLAKYPRKDWQQIKKTLGLWQKKK